MVALALGGAVPTSRSLFYLVGSRLGVFVLAGRGRKLVRFGLGVLLFCLRIRFSHIEKYIYNVIKKNIYGKILILQ